MEQRYKTVQQLIPVIQDKAELRKILYALSIKEGLKLLKAFASTQLPHQLQAFGNSMVYAAICPTGIFKNYITYTCIIQFIYYLHRLLVGRQWFHRFHRNAQYGLDLVVGPDDFEEEGDVLPRFFSGHPVLLQIAAVIGRHACIICIFALQELIPDFYVAFENPGLIHHDRIVSGKVTYIEHIILHEYERRIHSIV